MQTTKKQETPILKLNPLTKHPHKQCFRDACKPAKPKLPKGMRRIKIQPKYARRIGYQEAYPSILLSGKWLQQQGFKCDNYVIISEKKGRLVIKLE